MTTRRAFLKTAGASAAALAAAAPERPNLLIVMTDQQSADAMSCRIGRRFLYTPNMDSLAASGTLFERAYCANPLCVPSRTSMFTGRYPAETGVQINDVTPIDRRKFPCMGTIFQSAGYATAFFGKWHMPFPVKEPATHGFEVTATQRGDATAAERAAAFIRARREKPFLLVASLLNPHNICEWARGQDLPEGAIGNPPAVEQCPPRRANGEPQAGEPDIVTLMRRSYQATPMFPVGKFDDRKWREYVWAYYRMIEKVDGEVGKILTALRESGQEGRTVVVFTADHGDCQGAHRWNQKTVLYEEATRVPLIISRKGTTRAETSRRLAHTGVDLIPTLCDYAGIAVPKGLPGLSLKSAADPRQYVVVNNRMAQGAEVDGRLPVPDGRMVRSRRFKYCAYSEGKLRESLVDLEADPGEMTNLAARAQYREELERHRAMLREWCRQTGDSFMVP